MMMMTMTQNGEGHDDESGPRTMSLEVQTANACLLETNCYFELDVVLHSIMMVMHDSAQNSNLE